MKIDNVRVVRTYLTSDKLARVRVTFDRRVWLDCGGCRTAYAGALPVSVPINKYNVLKLANQ